MDIQPPEIQASKPDGSPDRGDLHKQVHLPTVGDKAPLPLLLTPTLNQQPIEKATRQEDGALDIQEIFLTLQGEGPFAGTPAVFIRTAACNLCCPLCDTDYTSKRKLFTVQELLKTIKALLSAENSPNTRLLVLTGGEPLRQNIVPFVTEAIGEEGFQVQIETNGTLEHPGLSMPDITTVCSPKTPKLHESIIGARGYWVSAFKYILRASEVDSDGLPTKSLGYEGQPCRPPKGFYGKVYLQPLDEKDPEKNKANTQAAIESCLRNGYILCLQTHKIVGLP